MGDIGHNGGPSFADVVSHNLETGLYWAQRDCLIRAVRDPGLSHRHRLVIAELIAMSNSTTGVCFPGRRALAEATGYTEAGIAKTIYELVDWGYVVSERRAPEPGRRPLAHYSIVRPTTEELQSAIKAHIDAIRSASDMPSSVNVIRFPTLPPEVTLPAADVTPVGNDTPGRNVTPTGNVRNPETGKTKQNQQSPHDVTPTGNVTPGVPTVTSKDTSNTKHIPSGERGTGRERGSRLNPTRELCAQCGTWAMANFQITRDQAYAEWESFTDFWVGRPGKDGMKLDWFATWRNWVRNSRSKYRRRMNAGAEEAFPQIDEPALPLAGEQADEAAAFERERQRIRTEAEAARRARLGDG